MSSHQQSLAAGRPAAVRAKPSEPALDRAVTVWLWAIAALVLVIVFVGGATRLTESGLSITQWKPIEGVIPPLTRPAWLKAFAAYKAIPQFHQLFPDMDLAQFKHIYFWEWSHRLLARAIGVAFLLPLLWFWFAGKLTASMGRKLGLVFLLGALQGAVGWWMVESGLTKRVEVEPQRLATHLLLASILYLVLIAMATDSRRPPIEAGLARRHRRSAAVLPFLVLIQIALGALVAGSRAGWTYNTWPLMDGHFVPPLAELASMRPLLVNFFENVTTVQFDHRMMAYCLLLAALVHSLDVNFAARGSRAARRAAGLALLVLCQAGIGVMTLLLVVPIWAGLLHQFFAMIVLGAATVHWRLSRAEKAHGAVMAAVARPV